MMLNHLNGVLGCILAGCGTRGGNALLTKPDFEFMLRDSRAQDLVNHRSRYCRPLSRAGESTRWAMLGGWG
jgi:hypothetical protein